MKHKPHHKICVIEGSWRSFGGGHTEYSVDIEYFADKSLWYFWRREVTSYSGGYRGRAPKASIGPYESIGQDDLPPAAREAVRLLRSQRSREARRRSAEANETRT